jgi:hypothetical protein
MSVILLIAVPAAAAATAAAPSVIGPLLLLGLIGFVLWRAIPAVINYQTQDMPYLYTAGFYHHLFALPFRGGELLLTYMGPASLTPWPNINLILKICSVILYVAALIAVVVMLSLITGGWVWAFVAVPAVAAAGWWCLQWAMKGAATLVGWLFAPV